MRNCLTDEVKIDGQIYGINWQDFGSFYRLNVFQNERKIGFRDLPVSTELTMRTVVYLVRRMVGGYEPVGKTIDACVRKGTWINQLRKLFFRSKDSIRCK